METQKIFSRDFILCFFAQFALAFVFTILIPTFPLYLSGKGAAEAQIGLLIGIFSVSSLVLRPFVGRALLKIPERKFMITGTILYSFSALAYLFASPFWPLFFVRILHGVGLACFSTAAFTLIANISPAAHRGQSLGYYHISINVAFAVAPYTGMLLINRFSFQVLFLVCLGLSLCAFLITTRLTHSAAHPRPELGSKANPAFEDGVEERRSGSPLSPSTGLRALSPSASSSGPRGLSNGKPRPEGRGVERLTPLQGVPPNHSSASKESFLSREALPSAIMAFMVNIVWGALMAFFPLYAVGHGVSNPGLFFGVVAVVHVVGRTFGARILDLYSRERVMFPCLIAYIISMSVLAFSRTLPMFILVALIWGIGNTFLYPTLIAYTLDRVRSSPGPAMATFTAIADLGAGSGSVIMGIVLQLTNYPTMFFSLVGISLVNLFYFHRFIRKKGGQRHADL